MTFALERIEYSGGFQPLPVPFPYIDREHVTVSVNGGAFSEYTWLNDQMIVPYMEIPAGAIVEVKRTTPNIERIVDFQDSSMLSEIDLDLDSTQLFYLIQESSDASDRALQQDVYGNWDAKGYRIVNAGWPIGYNDVVTVGYLGYQYPDVQKVAAHVPELSIIASNLFAKGLYVTDLGTIVEPATDIDGEPSKGALNTIAENIDGLKAIIDEYDTLVQAVPAALAAIDSAKEAQLSAGNSQNSAYAALLSENAARGFANTAGEQAERAEYQANIAKTKAGEAASSASSATASASSASSSASSAGANASSAASSATSAGVNASSSASSATSASASATRAEQAAAAAAQKVAEIVAVPVPNLDGKLDKITTAASYPEAYVRETIFGQGLVQGSMVIAQSAMANTLARRLATGQLVGAAPTSKEHLVNKEYADTLVQDSVAPVASVCAQSGVVLDELLATVKLLSLKSDPSKWPLNVRNLIYTGSNIGDLAVIPFGDGSFGVRIAGTITMTAQVAQYTYINGITIGCVEDVGGFAMQGGVAGGGVWVLANSSYGTPPSDIHMILAAGPKPFFQTKSTKERSGTLNDLYELWFIFRETSDLL